MPSNSAELEGAVVHALRAVLGCSKSDTRVEFMYARGVLGAWEKRDVKLLDVVRQAHLLESAETPPFSENDIVTPACPDLSSSLRSDDVVDSLRSSSCSSLCSEHSSSEKSAEDAATPRGAIREERKVYNRFRTRLPAGSRVSNTPGKGATRAIRRALRERPLEVCLDAVDGAFEWWKRQGKPHKGIEAIFGTYRGSSSLAERIDWLATWAPQSEPSGIPPRILNRIGVRDRIQDVQREIRAAFDLPHSASAQRNAAQSELWLMSLGLYIALTGTLKSGGMKFEIREGLGHRVFVDE